MVLPAASCLSRLVPGNLVCDTLQVVNCKQKQLCIWLALYGNEDQIRALNHAERMQAVLFIGDLAYADDYVSALTQTGL